MEAKTKATTQGEKKTQKNMLTGRTFIAGLLFLDTDFAFRMDNVAPLPLFDMVDWAVGFSVDITIAAGSWPSSS